jgi:hypothetical protein
MFTITQLITFGILAVAAAVAIALHIRKGSFSQHFVATMFYAFGACAVAMAVFPEPHTPLAAIPDRWYIAMIGGVLVVGGGLLELHVVLRRGRWDPHIRRLTYLIVPSFFLIAWAQQRGFQGVSLYAVVLPPVWIAVFMMLRAQQAALPANQIMRELSRGDLSRAIQIGESIAPAQRDQATKFNLAVAYERASRLEDALALANSVSWPADAPQQLHAELKALRERLGRSISSAT